MIEARKAWCRAQAAMSERRLIFIDKTQASTKLAKTHGRCARSERLEMAYPHGHGKTTTYVGEPTDRGFSPYVLDEAMDRNVFKALDGLLAFSIPMIGSFVCLRVLVEQVLAPQLRSGDIVILNSLSSHNVAGVRKAVTARGADICDLPPQSPDLNPIENAFAERRAMLRKETERTIDGLRV